MSTGTTPCYHGGAFFQAVGPGFDDLRRRHAIINADVLDAWFPPAPAALRALHEHLGWLARTSPPTQCEGLVAAIADARGIPPECCLPGGGSSDLIFRAFTTWLQPESRVLICDPTYGEYQHVLEQVVGCRVERLALDAGDGYRLPPDRLAERVHDGFDLVVLVNPNSPTGTHVPAAALRGVLEDAPPGTRFWIDETYVDFLGPGHSLEAVAAARADTVVCKSMSKAYALSGLRVGYLCGSRATLEVLRRRTPPWVVGLPAQLAAVEALQHPGYYLDRWRETRRLRAELRGALQQLPGWRVHAGTANFLLCHLPGDGPDAATLCERARAHGLFLRDARTMGRTVDGRTIRIAVKDTATNRRMVAILQRVAGREAA